MKNCWVGVYTFTANDVTNWPATLPYPSIKLEIAQSSELYATVFYSMNHNTLPETDFRLFLRTSVLPKWIYPTYTSFSCVDAVCKVTWNSDAGGWTFYPLDIDTRQDLITRPAPPAFFKSQLTVVPASGTDPQGDPFIIRNPTPTGMTDRYIMWYFTGASGSTTSYRTAQSLEGTASNAWSAATVVPSLDCHKFVLLVDEYGTPVKIDGKYHGYGSRFVSGSKKCTFHYSADSLLGTWTRLSTPILPLGGPGTYDSYCTDTPYAIYESRSKTVYLWYMANPENSMPSTGYASVTLLAKSDKPDGFFVKNYTPVITTGANGTWNYGWIGGVQIRQTDKTNRYTMLYNAGDTRPTVAGAEPASSQIGVAFSTSLDGPWVPFDFNPIVRKRINAQELEDTHVWRGHMAWDEYSAKWYLYYNCNGVSTGEVITYAREDSYYGYFNGSKTVSAAALTTVDGTWLQIPYPGVYELTATVGVELDSTAAGGTATVQLTIRDGIGYVFSTAEVKVAKGTKTPVTINTSFGISGYTEARLSSQVTNGYEAGKITITDFRISMVRVE